MKIKTVLSAVILSVIAAMTFVNTAMAAGNIMPSFATLPAGWVTDRYEPAAFANVGSYQGRVNVLGISIDHSTDFAARPAPYQGIFYNTQGRKFTFASIAGAGSVLSADLYIPAGWANANDGNVRSDMWGTMVDAGNEISNYAIIGFTNFGGTPRLRVWDEDTTNGWVNLSTPVAYGSWVKFAIVLNADSKVDYYVNGTVVYTDVATNNSSGTKEVIMQAYNFADPSFSGATPTPYTAHWSNTVSVPSSAGACKNGGWQALTRADSTGFRNQGDCVSYSNNGR